MLILVATVDAVVLEGFVFVSGPRFRIEAALTVIAAGVDVVGGAPIEGLVEVDEVKVGEVIAVGEAVVGVEEVAGEAVDIVMGEAALSGLAADGVAVVIEGDKDGVEL
jgi:hypothetical protein